MRIARPIVLVLALLGVSAPVVSRAQPAGPPAEAVTLDRGPATIRGTIRGDESRRFVVELTEGQTLRLVLESRNPSANFNVWAPGSDTAMVIGSVVGPEFEGPVPATGVYTVDLFLVRSAARRNERAPFVLTIGVGETTRAR